MCISNSFFSIPPKPSLYVNFNYFKFLIEMITINMLVPIIGIQSMPLMQKGTIKHDLGQLYVYIRLDFL